MTDKTTTNESLFGEIDQATDQILTLLRRVKEEATDLYDKAEDATAKYHEKNGDIDYGDTEGIALQNGQRTTYSLLVLSETLIKALEAAMKSDRKLTYEACKQADAVARAEG